MSNALPIQYHQLVSNVLVSYNCSAKKSLEHDPEVIEGFHKMLIIKTLIKACGWPLLLAQLLRLMGIVLDFMNPQLLRWG